MESLKRKATNVEKKVSSNKDTSKHGSIKLFTVKLQGLAYNHKKKDIKQFFRPLKAKSVRVPAKIKGIAYVGFKTEQHRRKALLKNKSFLGINCNYESFILRNFLLVLCIFIFRWEANIRNKIRNKRPKV